MEIDLEKLIGAGLNLDGYLVLYCLYKKREDFLVKYINSTTRIPTKVFQGLVENEFITCDSEDTFTLSNMKLTTKFEKMFFESVKEEENPKTEFDKLFQELWDCYPNKVINLSTGEPRYLRRDEDRCIKLYRSTIVDKGKIDYDLHKTIIQCVNYIVNIKTKSRSLGYMLMFSTFLQQKEWKSVIDDVKMNIEKTGAEIKQNKVEVDGGENKTQLGSKEF